MGGWVNEECARLSLKVITGKCFGNEKADIWEQVDLSSRAFSAVRHRTYDL